jgi:hypothetical protein
MPLPKAARRILAIGVGLITLGLCGLAYFVFAPDEIAYRREIHQGNGLVLNIEKFRREQGRLPGSVEELAITDADTLRLFYAKCSESRYIVWFGTTLGESMTYTSETRRWHDLNVPCTE